MNLEQLVVRLAEPKKTTAGYDARCPAHEDTHASLSVAEGVKGLVLKCHAGCATRDVLAALSLRASDLFSALGPARSRIVAEYDYLDAAGARAYQVVRFEPKDFRQRRPSRNGEPAKGGWVWNLTGVPMVLYRLPSVLAAAATGQRIYIVEGEKDADALTGLGVVATSAPGGAAARWRPQYTEALKGADEVLVLPDADEPGRAHARKVLAALRAGGVPARVVVLPGAGKDVSDWIAAGGTAAALAALTASSPVRLATVGDLPGPAPLRDLGKNLESACRLMRDDTARGLALWPGRLGYNLMAGRIECDGRPVEDHHITHVREQVAACYCLPGGGTPLRLSSEQVREAVELIAHEHEYHPVKEWLQALPAAGAGHIERIARDGLGLEDAHELGLVRRWFLSAAARALRPGCQVDSMLVLVGGQGVLKTTFFRVLAGPWYGSGPLRPDDKDTLARLHRAWIYEWAELATMGRRSLEEMRDFLTTVVDYWRPSYGRTIVERPRRTILAGTTNVPDFLRDETGNRRFWPVLVPRPIDVAVAAELRAPAFAEARDALAGGERWWLSADEETAQAARVVIHEAEDVWQETVERWLATQLERGRNALTTAEVLRWAVWCDLDRQGAREAHRAAVLLRRAGWVSAQVRFGGPPVRVWHPAGAVDLARLPAGYAGEPGS